MLENDDQQAFMEYLAKVLKATDQKDFEAKVQSLGKDKIAELYQQFKSSQTVSAKLGAKLDYINRLNGRCPEGFEMFKSGGCIKCRKKADSKNAANLKSNIVAKKRFGNKEQRSANRAAMHDDSRGSFLNMANQ